jgi:hypothetical protein
MINFGFGAVVKPLVNVAGAITEMTPSQALPTVVAGTGVAAYSKQVPTTGFSITVPDRTTSLILDPAGTLATGTVVLPAIPLDGQIVEIMSSQTITSLTVSPNTGQSIKNAATTLSAGGMMAWGYCLGNTTWYRRA